MTTSSSVKCTGHIQAIRPHLRQFLDGDVADDPLPQDLDLAVSIPMILQRGSRNMSERMLWNHLGKYGLPRVELAFRIVDLDDCGRQIMDQVLQGFVLFVRRENHLDLGLHRSLLDRDLEISTDFDLRAIDRHFHQHGCGIDQCHQSLARPGELSRSDFDFQQVAGKRTLDRRPFQLQFGQLQVGFCCRNMGFGKFFLVGFLAAAIFSSVFAAARFAFARSTTNF